MVGNIGWQGFGPNFGQGRSRLDSHHSIFLTDSDQPIIVDLARSNFHQVILKGNRTLVIVNPPPPGATQVFLIDLIQDSSGSRTVTWFTTIKWPAGTTPTLTTTANKKDSFSFKVTGVGTYDGFIVGQNL